MCQIWSKSVKRLRSYHDLTVFENVRRRHLGFLKFQFFNDGTLERPNLRHPVKFHQDRSIRCKIVTIFRFFKIAAARHLGF